MENSKPLISAPSLLSHPMIASSYFKSKALHKNREKCFETDIDKLVDKTYETDILDVN